jgi:hypothetical protein
MQMGTKRFSMRTNGLKGSKPSAYFFFFAPIVVRVAFEAARLGAVCSGMVALLAGADAGDEDVFRFLARACIRVATVATRQAMFIVIKDSVLEPAHSGIRFCDRGQSGVRTGCERMALFAGFGPQQLFGFRYARVNPLL